MPGPSAVISVSGRSGTYAQRPSRPAGFATRRLVVVGRQPLIVTLNHDDLPLEMGKVSSLISRLVTHDHDSHKRPRTGATVRAAVVGRWR
jgi:hypothetical protein